MDEREPIIGDPLHVADREATSAADVALGAAVVTADATLRAARWGGRFGRSVAVAGYRTARGAGRWVPPVIAEPVTRRTGMLVWRTGQQGELVREQAPVVAAVVLAYVLDRVVPWVVANALDRVDLTALVAERVDLDAVVARVDLDKAVSRVDLDAIVARVDLDSAVARVDLDAAVARVDLDGAVARVDVDRIVQSVDRAVIMEIARQVVDEIDLPLIIRESSGGVAADLVTDVRLQTIDADQSFARLLDKVFRRTGNPGGPSNGTEPAT